jgi:hypothetical protein
MIISLCIVVALVAITVTFWTETTRLQKNIDLLNNYAFSSFERIIAIEQLIINNTEEDNDQA